MPDAGKLRSDCTPSTPLSDSDTYKRFLELAVENATARMLEDTAKSASGKDPLDVQVGGDHYKKLGRFQPHEVAHRWGTEEEYRGYCKFTALSYLCPRHKSGDETEDMRKAMHTLQLFFSLTDNKEQTDDRT